jgi:hypothetical protein
MGRRSTKVGRRRGFSFVRAIERRVLEPRRHKNGVVFQLADFHPSALPFVLPLSSSERLPADIPPRGCLCQLPTQRFHTPKPCHYSTPTDKTRGLGISSSGRLRDRGSDIQTRTDDDDRDHSVGKMWDHHLHSGSTARYEEVEGLVGMQQYGRCCCQCLIFQLS